MSRTVENNPINSRHLDDAKVDEVTDLLTTSRSKLSILSKESHAAATTTKKNIQMWQIFLKYVEANIVQNNKNSTR